MVKKANVSTTEEGDDEMADVSKSEMNKVDKDRAGGPAEGSYRFKGEQDHLKHPDSKLTFRQDVENVAAGDLNWPPKEPYPTGNPPDPRESHASMHGYYKTDDEGNRETSPNQKRK